TGGRYDPAADAWTPVATAGAPAPRQDHVAVWTGERMIVWGGTVYDGDPPSTRNDGGVYDPFLDAWTGISAAGAPESGLEQAGVWTGRELLIWNGPTNAARYDPQTNSWSQ